jgi:ubiquinone/menaquinone biosynthesis C-methylase UbiE
VPVEGEKNRLMGSTPRFRSDLYQGTAAFYHRYRVPYPAQLVTDLVSRTALSGTGRLLDLACGPGRVTFALSEYFTDVVAVDQEAESVSYATAVAAERGTTHIHWQVGRAEDLDLPEKFELVTIGDAFHRLDRPRIADLASEWLQPGGHIALLWTSMPWQGTSPWQRATLEWVEHWMHLTGSIRNIPPDLARSLTRVPHLTVLTEAGFTVLGTYEFSAVTTWTLETLIGFAHSTSILSPAALGEHAEGFERDLHERLLTIHPNGRYEDLVSFAYDLAVKA